MLDFKNYYYNNINNYLTPVDNLFCSEKNVMVPYYAIERIQLRQGNNIFYTKHIATGSQEKNVRKILSGLQNDRLYVIRFSYPESNQPYFAYKNTLFQYDKNKVSMLMLLAVLSDCIPKLKRRNNDPSHYRLLIDKSFPEKHEKLFKYLKKNYIQEISDLNVDIIYTSDIDKYCFNKYKFPVSVKTMEQLHHLNRRIKYDLQQLPVPQQEADLEIAEEAIANSDVSTRTITAPVQTVRTTISQLHATGVELEREFSAFLIEEA